VVKKKDGGRVVDCESDGCPPFGVREGEMEADSE